MEISENKNWVEICGISTVPIILFVISKDPFLSHQLSSIEQGTVKIKLHEYILFSHKLHLKKMSSKG